MLIVKGYMLIVVMLRGPDSNRRPPGYGPGELPTALPRDSGNNKNFFVRLLGLEPRTTEV